MKMNDIVNSDNIGTLIQRTLNYVDPRLIDHGMRVAYMVCSMLKEEHKCSDKEYQQLCYIAMLHDIGAYKTEVINELFSFEANHMWQHSLYGYLFIERLTPLKEYAEIIKYHHMPLYELEVMDEVIYKPYIYMLQLADRLDIYMRMNGCDEDGVLAFLEEHKNDFDKDTIQLFIRTQKHQNILSVLNGSNIAFENFLPSPSFTNDEIEHYLRLLVYAIDFRSENTVTHTVTTAEISNYCARKLQLDDDTKLRIQYGALMHDLGKIAIPVEILEFPGKLSMQAMQIMRTHVEKTKEILGNHVDMQTCNIAAHHHEKLDGTGYPNGLIESDLSLGEQIVAVADIVSALLGIRSYKSSFSKDKTISIIKDLADEGKINKQVVTIICDNFDEMMNYVSEKCVPVFKMYRSIRSDYETLLAEMEIL